MSRDHGGILLSTEISMVNLPSAKLAEKFLRFPHEFLYIIMFLLWNLFIRVYGITSS